MKLKTLVLSVATSFVLVGAQAAFACSTAAWGGGTPTPPGGGAVGSPLAGEPDDATPVARYSGRCGLRSAASGSYVQDGNPSAESRLRARFYVHTGATGGTAVVYRGLNTAGTVNLEVAYNATAGTFEFKNAGGSAVSSAAVAANKWYAIELDFNTTAGNTTATIQGNGAAAPLATVTVPAATGVIDYVQLGWIAGTATGGAITTDAYESRRATAIGRLCRGDANADVVLSVADRIVMTNEILGTALSTGQPDANEDGIVSVADRIVVTNRILASDACP